MRHWIGVMVAIALAGPGAAIAAEPAATAMGQPEAPRPNIVMLAPVEGSLPADSVDARAFIAGVSEAFDPDFHLTESRQGGPPRVTMALASRFRLVQGDPFGDEWELRLSVDGWTRGQGGGSPGGVIVGVAVLSPDSVRSGARPTRVRERLSFDTPLEPRSAWWSHAGRAAGLLAVETLHRGSGDLDPDTRLRLDGTRREPVPEGDPPAPGR